MGIVYGAFSALGNLGRKTVKEGTTLAKRVQGMQKAADKAVNGSSAGFQYDAKQFMYDADFLRKEADGTTSAHWAANLYSDKGDGSLRTGVKVGAGLAAAGTVAGAGYALSN